MSKKSKGTKTVHANISKPTPQEEPVLKIAKINLLGVIITGILTLVGLIVTALLAPIALEYFRHAINTVPTPIEENTAIFTPLPSESPAATLAFPSTPSMTETFTPPPTDIPTTTIKFESETMTVMLNSSTNSGKIPLQVNFNAKDSFVTFTNGTTSSCVNNPNACTFTWTISREGKVIYGPEQGNAGFSFNFQKRGNHTVVVYICRGNACSFGVATVEVK